MARAGWLLVVSSLLSLRVFSAENAEHLSKEELKMHSLFLMQQNRIEEALDRYRDYCDQLGHLDFEALHTMGLIMLQKGIQEADPQTYLMTLFGAGISGSSGALEILEKGIDHPDPQIQLLALHFISQFEDDRASELLNRAMSSDFLATRMEAAFYLAQRKHPMAAGQIEGLMYRLPPFFKPYFPAFFALLGTSDATATLRRLIEDSDPQVRIESILNVAKSGRDDFLPLLRKRLTHFHIAELEATIFAVGQLKDSASSSKLKKLATSPTDSVRLAAALALLQLGDRSFFPTVLTLAREHNLFAIASLGSISESEETLVELASSNDIQIRLNAGLALLQRRDPRALPALREFFLQDAKDLAFHPFPSVGRTMTAFKAIAAAELRSKDPRTDLSYSLAIREHFLREAVHLPEPAFLELVRSLFRHPQLDLIPTAIALLENLRTEGAIALLQEGAQTTTSPLIRTYCHLALFRLKEEGPHEDYVHQWVIRQRDAQLIRLRPLLPWQYRLETSDDYSLSAEETSKLLIDSFLAIANQREEKGLSFLIETLQLGNPQNRYALIGLLMRSSE
jgi:HEAT repeat protein